VIATKHFPVFFTDGTEEAVDPDTGAMTQTVNRTVNAAPSVKV
jgi:hypothetical protein